MGYKWNKFVHVFQSKGVQFYGPSHTYPTSILLVLSTIAAFIKILAHHKVSVKEPLKVNWF